jgi:hypothetical protein
MTSIINNAINANSTTPLPLVQGGTGASLGNGTTGQLMTSQGSSASAWKNSGFITPYVVNPTAGIGNYTTIQSAITAASAGNDVYITPGTYTENLTLKAGVNLCTIKGNEVSGLVTIVGNATMSVVGTVEIANINLQTNGSNPFLTVSGSVASIVNLVNCVLTVGNQPGISFTSSSASAQINMSRCSGDLNTNTATFYTMTSPGTITIEYCFFTNSGASPNSSTNSTGLVDLYYSHFLSRFSTTGSGNINKNYCFIDTSAINQTGLTLFGTGTSDARFTDNLSGTASAISVGSGCTINCYKCLVNSSNTNAITGAGTINYTDLSFSGTSNTINVTTQNPIPFTLANGGTNASLTATANNLVYSTSTALALLATANSAALVTNSSGVPAWSSTMTNGQVIIGSTSGTPTAATLTAGSNVTITNGAGSITIASSGGGGGGITWQSVQTGNFSPAASNAYPVNTTSTAITATLPASPSAGNVIMFTDYAGTFATNALTINPNSLKINGSTSNLVLSNNRESLGIVYIDATQGWITFDGLNFNFPILINYLIIAGGGGGGGSGYGNGGGGGGGGYIIGSLYISSGYSYPITVGGGGAGTITTAFGANGNNSILGIAMPSTSTSIGGGGGACAATNGANGIGRNGGSGGGGSGNSSTQAGGSGTAGQGNNGGTSNATGSGAGGGGGATAVGGDGATGVGGNGGAGISSSISGSAVIYSSGGGGSGFFTAGTGGTNAGNGGTLSVSPTSGTANLGGGGGGYTTFGTAGNGGSGVVIISYAGSQIATGGTVTSSGGNTIHTFYSSGTFST